MGNAEAGLGNRGPALDDGTGIRQSRMACACTFFSIHDVTFPYLRCLYDRLCGIALRAGYEVIILLAKDFSRLNSDFA